MVRTVHCLPGINAPNFDRSDTDLSLMQRVRLFLHLRCGNMICAMPILRTGGPAWDPRSTDLGLKLRHHAISDRALLNRVETLPLRGPDVDG